MFIHVTTTPPKIISNRINTLFNSNRNTEGIAMNVMNNQDNSVKVTWVDEVYFI